MAIIIKGIDMPEDDTMILLVGKGMVIEVADGFATPKRPIEWADVPTPHGRLIDADEFVKYVELEYETREISHPNWIKFRVWCGDQPTIIEAEE